MQIHNSNAYKKFNSIYVLQNRHNTKNACTITFISKQIAQYYF